jgi:hypothetical protein
MRYFVMHRCVLAILGAFPKQVRKATVSFVMSVGLPVYAEQLSSRWVNFRESLLCRSLQKKIEQVPYFMILLVLG